MPTLALVENVNNNYSLTMATTDESDSDSQDEAQMKQFLEAADHTLLNNDMFQPKSKSDTAIQIPAPPQFKSERHLDPDENGNGTAAENDLKISEKMQTHFWNKLSKIIQNQIEFCKIETREQSDEILIPHCVKLVSHAECYLNSEIVDIDSPGPLKKPIIRKRRLSEETGNDAPALAECVVSGEEILDAKDTIYWFKRRTHPEKFFEYKSNQKIKGHELLHGVEVMPTNVFTLQRLKNNWDESKINQRKKKCNKKKING